LVQYVIETPCRFEKIKLYISTGFLKIIRLTTGVEYSNAFIRINAKKALCFGPALVFVLFDKFYKLPVDPVFRLDLWHIASNACSVRIPIEHIQVE